MSLHENIQIYYLYFSKRTLFIFSLFNRFFGSFMSGVSKNRFLIMSKTVMFSIITVFKVKNPLKRYGIILHFLISTFLVMIIFFLSGCSRTHHRMKADRDANILIQERLTGPKWSLQDYTINTDPRSRYHDPFDPDCEPMPEDDPVSHQLMHCVDGKRNGDDCGKNGYTDWTENPMWAQYLIVDQEGDVLLDKETAVELALLHSPSYQTELETAYISALDVTLARFAFDVHYSGREMLDYTVNGKSRGGNSTLENKIPFSAEKMTATGAQFVVGLANTMTWQFAGENTFRTNSLLNFSIVQPLLRGAGRDIVLESLTLQERRFLADIRSLARFQQDFYIRTVHSGNGGGGYLDLLSQKVKIQNQRQNLVQLEDNLNRMIELANANKVNAYQVETTRLGFLQSQNTLISLIGTYEGQIENYLTNTLGLPPDLKVKVEDPLLSNFELMAPSLTTLQRESDNLQRLIRDETQPIPEDAVEQLKTLRSKIKQEIKLVYSDFNRLESSKEERIRGLEMLANRPEVKNGDVSASICDVDAFLARLELRREEIPEQEQVFEKLFHLISLFEKYDRETMSEKIVNEDFDNETLDTIYRLDLLDMLPKFQKSVQSIHNRYSEEFRTSYFNKLFELRLERRELQQQLLRIQLAKESFGKTSEMLESIENMYIKAEELLEWNRLQSDKIEQIIESEIQALIENRELGEADEISNAEKILLNIDTLPPDFDFPITPLPGPAEAEKHGELELPPEENDAPVFIELPSDSEDTTNGIPDLDDILANLPGFEVDLKELMGRESPRVSELSQEAENIILEIEKDPYRNWLNKIVQKLYNELLVLSIVQSRTRLDSITLTPIDVSPEEAFEVAGENRLDWMNRKAELVDSWRNIEVQANRLKGALSVKFSGDIGTMHNNPLRFDAKNSSMSVGLEWDTPLNRKAEQNEYRKAQIRYQQARRDYYQYVDSVQKSLRNQLRNVKNDQINFELQRAQIFVAIIKVDQFQLELTKPQKSTSGRSDVVNDNVAKNLLDALVEQLNAQNSFLNIWVAYQARRLDLESEMGILELDDRGLWLDHGPMTQESVSKFKTYR